VLVGSLPYFAPEVVACKPYDSKCDVFSFALLAWEVFTLRKAFRNISHADYARRVILNKERPHIPRNIKPLIKLMLSESWDHDPQKRPNMKRIATLIRGDLNENCKGNDSILHRTEHMANRTRHSIRVQRERSLKRFEQPSSHGDWKL
jgi:serine/threonine protein kinase